MGGGVGVVVVGLSSLGIGCVGGVNVGCRVCCVACCV